MTNIKNIPIYDPGIDPELDKFVNDLCNNASSSRSLPFLGQKIEKLQRALNECYYHEACGNGAGHMQALAYAKKRVDEIN